jgi:hypothetical protein
MNAPHTGLSAFDIAHITSVVSSLVANANTTTEIVYTRTGGGRAYDPGSGTSSYTDATTTLSGCLSPLTLDEATRVDGAQVGDVQLLIRFADLTNEPATDDRFTAGTVPYRVYRVTRGPLDTHWCVFAHRAS